ncbi:hypothetical protein SD37_11820 [Amycolatopsis orientalis]|uniref:Uncharacterized protein n=2 Tax=Amycolatopsis orientalis TaxID=31958 RepID=A0A193BVK9_AMYOR|nr:hypothetical protein SD37_11820 [Amycolatopsis orientalis]
MRAEVIPGLIITASRFEIVAAGVAEHAPHVGPLTWEEFTTPARWAAIPDLEGKVSKFECTLVTSEKVTVKVNDWYRPDTRGGEEEQIPHNHRWDSFTGHLLGDAGTGGYTELRFYRTNVDPETGRADVEMERVTHGSPTANVLEHGVYHEIPEILEPGTLSLMVCGYGEYGNWGHLDIHTGRVFRDQPVAGFKAMFAKLNPHLRPQ